MKRFGSRSWCNRTRSAPSRPMAVVSAGVARCMPTAFTLFGSAIDCSLRAFGVPLALHSDPRCGILDFTEVIGRQLDRRRADVLVEPLDLPSAWYRNDPGLLRQQPC